MSERFDEKKIAEENILNDNKLADVVGGTDGEEYTTYFVGTFICPLCGMEHSFKFTMGGLKESFNYILIEEGSPCKKISYLRTIKSFDGKTHIGILSFEAADKNRNWYDVQFTVKSAVSDGTIIIL